MKELCTLVQAGILHPLVNCRKGQRMPLRLVCPSRLDDVQLRLVMAGTPPETRSALFALLTTLPSQRDTAAARLPQLAPLQAPSLHNASSRLSGTKQATAGKHHIIKRDVERSSRRWNPKSHSTPWTIHKNLCQHGEVHLAIATCIILVVCAMALMVDFVPPKQCCGRPPMSSRPSCKLRQCAKTARQAQARALQAIWGRLRLYGRCYAHARRLMASMCTTRVGR